ncbi:Wadjet anti-phage system protein JetD domain-containing protein [Erythrobacter aureus]|nr:Wadjet anti-phage system protein JetD domain-containing protein [Erythrobacter aureus]
MPSLKVDFGDATSAEVHTAEKLLVEAEKARAITIVRPKHAEHILQRIRLADAGALADFLGKRPAADKASAVLDRIAPLLEGAASWIQDEIEAGLLKWNRGDRAFRIEANNLDRIETFTKLLLAIDRGVDGVDLRTFSNEAGVDSKAFERHKGTIIQIARRAFDWEDASEEEVLQQLGFRPFFQLVHIKGPISVPSMNLDASAVHPFIGLPPGVGSMLQLRKPIKAILTVENLTSFNRHTREVDQPDVAVLYSSGFPGRPVVDALSRLAQIAPDATIHHWGDIDVGGIRIFRNIEQRIGRPVRPHLMNRDLAEQLGKPKEPKPALARIAGDNSGVADLADYLSKGQPKHLEQEIVSPQQVELPS